MTARSDGVAMFSASTSDAVGVDAVDDGPGGPAGLVEPGEVADGAPPWVVPVVGSAAALSAALTSDCASDESLPLVRSAVSVAAPDGVAARDEMSCERTAGGAVLSCATSAASTSARAEPVSTEDGSCVWMTAATSCTPAAPSMMSCATMAARSDGDAAFRASTSDAVEVDAVVDGGGLIEPGELGTVEVIDGTPPCDVEPNDGEACSASAAWTPVCTSNESLPLVRSAVSVAAPDGVAASDEMSCERTAGVAALSCSTSAASTSARAEPVSAGDGSCALMAAATYCTPAVPSLMRCSTMAVR